MLVNNLLKQFNVQNLPFALGNLLGDGMDGEVFDIQSSNKVIKLSVCFGDHRIALKKYNKLKTVFDYLINTPTEPYVCTYEYNYIGNFSRIVYQGFKEELSIYYYIMEKLNKISEDEKKVFHSIISHEDRGIFKNFSSEKIDEMLKGLGRGLDFDAEKIKLFCANIKNAHVLHNDLHARNIMKDNYGNFKLVDLESCSLKLENKTCLKK